MWCEAVCGVWEVSHVCGCLYSTVARLRVKEMPSQSKNSMVQSE